MRSWAKAADAASPKSAPLNTNTVVKFRNPKRPGTIFPLRNISRPRNTAESKSTYRPRRRIAFSVQNWSYKAGSLILFMKPPAIFGTIPIRDIRPLFISYICMLR